MEQLQFVGGDDSRGGTPVVTGQKTGRNDPCPCGSGKKYKKCHGAKARVAVRPVFGPDVLKIKYFPQPVSIPCRLALRRPLDMCCNLAC